MPKELLLTFINGPANLLNNKPKYPPDEIILDIWVLENFISVDLFFSTAFLNLVVWLVVNNNSWGKFFPLSISILIPKVALPFDS